MMYDNVFYFYPNPLNKLTVSSASANPLAGSHAILQLALAHDESAVD